MTLPQQLEDKKKGCGVDIGGVPCGEFIAHTEDEDGREWGKTYYCKHCNEIITILEQSIAEKNEFIRLLKKEISNLNIADGMGYTNVCRIIEQLQSQQNGKGDDALRQQTTSELSEGTKASIPSYKGATCKPETQSADISNLLQKQRQEILDIIDKIEPEIKKDLENPLLRKDDKGIVSGTCHIIKLKIIQQLNKKNNNNA